MSSFIVWLEQELENRGWKQADLARSANLDSAAVSMLLNGRRKPGEVTCNAIARAFGIPAETVFRFAGILPNHPGLDEDFEELKHIFNQMTDEEQEEFLAQGRLKIDLRNKRGEQHETPHARPAHV